MDELEFIKNEINMGKFVKLDESIAYGTVYKINGFGNLIKDGYEIGYLYLTVGSGIKKHMHINDIEMYQLIGGVLSIDGVCLDNNMCLLNQSHSIDKVTCNTIIKTCKISKLYLARQNMRESLVFDKVLKKQKIHK